MKCMYRIAKMLTGTLDNISGPIPGATAYFPTMAGPPESDEGGAGT